MTSDGADYLFVSDADPGRIYRVSISGHSFSIYVEGDPNLLRPIGLVYDPPQNRLLATTLPEV